MKTNYVKYSIDRAMEKEKLGKAPPPKLLSDNGLAIFLKNSKLIYEKNMKCNKSTEDLY